MTIAAFAAAAGFASYIYWPEDDIVINPNITESYRSSLEDEREEYINELLENSSDPDLYIKKGVVEKKLGLLSEAERSIEKVFDFKDVAEALSYMSNNQHFGKLVLKL